MPTRSPYVHSWEEPCEEEQLLTQALIIAVLYPETLTPLERKRLKRIAREREGRYNEVEPG